jgi:hypothetical protein
LWIGARHGSGLYVMFDGGLVECCIVLEGLWQYVFVGFVGSRCEMCGECEDSSRRGSSSHGGPVSSGLFIAAESKSPLIDWTGLVLDVVRRLVRLSEDGVVTRHAVVDAAEAMGVPRDRTEVTLARLGKEGVVFEPGHGLIMLSG